MIYVAHYRPLKTRLANNIQIFNEFMIANLTVFLFLMTDLTETNEGINDVGICFAVFFLVMIIGNVGLSVAMICKKTYLFAIGQKTRYYVKKYLRILRGEKMVDSETQEDMETLWPSDVANDGYRDYVDAFWEDFRNKDKTIKSKSQRVEVDLEKRVKKLGKSKKTKKGKKVKKKSNKTTFVEAKLKNNKSSTML